MSIGVLLIPLGYMFMWPVVARDERSPLLAAVVALAFSLLTMTVLLYLPGLLLEWWIAPLTTTLTISVGVAIGLALNPRFLSPRSWVAWWRGILRYARSSWVRLMLTGSIGLILLVIFAFDLYYPFIGDDTLSRYALHAREIYATHHIPPSVAGYPPGAPLAFTATWFAAGAPNEHLARLYPFVMASGTIGATYLLGREVANRDIGLLAAALIAWVPLFVRNALIAYVDIPATFPLTLAVLFAVRWYRRPQPRPALFAGLMLALAMLTKQAALTWAASLIAVPLIWSIAHRRAEWEQTLSAITLMLGPMLLFAGPWYTRNAILTGRWLPIAGEYHLLEAGAGLLGVVPPIATPSAFGIPLFLALSAGWLFGLWSAVREGVQTLRGEATPTPYALLLTAFLTPYWLAWWTTFSFDVRFLLFIMPIVAVYTAIGLGRLPLTGLPRAAAAPLIAALTAVAAAPGLGGVYWWLCAPFATSAERFERARPAESQLVDYITTHIEPDATLMLMDVRLAYFLPEYEVRTGYPTTFDELAGVDYLVTASATESVYTRLGTHTSPVYTHLSDPYYFEDVFTAPGGMATIKRILTTEAAR